MIEKMNGYTDYQNYVLNKIAYANLTGNCKPGMPLLACIPEKYEALRKEIETAGLSHLVLKDYTNNNDSGSRSGFCAIAVEDPVTGAVGVSYRGTENLDKITTENQIDMIDNIYTAVLGTSEQKREAVVFFEKNMNSNGANFLFGHSKGGELASEVYAKYHKLVQEMHLYNPQPINDLKLSSSQKDAFKSDKVDVVIIDGDFVTRLGKKSVFGDRISYMQCNGKKDNLVYPHQLEAASFNKDQSIKIETNPYVKYPKQKKIGDLAETIITTAQWGGLPKTTLLVLTVAKTYELIVQDVPNMIELFQKSVDRFIDMIDEVKERSNEIKLQLKRFAGGIREEIATWYNSNFNSGYKVASADTAIRVDTAKLRRYAERLGKVNQRLSTLDGRMDDLYFKVGLRDLFNLIHADLWTGSNWRITNCAKYLNETANDFEGTERNVAGQFQG